MGVDAVTTCARLGLTIGVITRHGKQSHLWNPDGRGKTFCGLAIVDFAPNADPEVATCSRCIERRKIQATASREAGDNNNDPQRSSLQHESKSSSVKEKSGD